MSSESSRLPTIDHLRMAAAGQGIRPTDADLAAVQVFLGTLLPALGEIEEGNEVAVAPAGLFLPGSEAG